MSGAPYSLLTYEDTRQFNGMTTTRRWKRMGEVIETGFMPLGKTMSEPDKQVLRDWIAGCALPAEGMGCE